VLFEIFMMNATGSNPVSLTNFGASTDVHPSWSPDGAKIAFTSTRDGNSEVYVMTATGSEVTNLTNHPESDFFPSWSSDGKRLAFVSERDGNREI
jgi:TolB protein